MVHKGNIKRAEKSDILGILEILNYEITHSTALYEYEPRSLAQQLDWFMDKQENNFPVIVVVKEGKVLGFGSFGAFRPRPAYRFTVEHSVYVHHEFHGQGIGKRLLKQLIALAKEDGYHSMIAVIDSLNAGSIQFHTTFGFVEIGQLREVGYKFDRWLDLTLMQLRIE